MRESWFVRSPRTSGVMAYVSVVCALMMSMACDGEPQPSSNDAGTTQPPDSAMPARDDGAEQTDAGRPTVDGGSVGLPIDSSGFTTFEPSADSRIIYVSSSLGDDANDGLSEESPVATVGRGKSLLRDGFPDWLLFRRGDEWHEPIGRWKLSGRSESERMLVGTYGDDPERPLFLTGTASAIYNNGADNTPESMNYLAFVGLAFIAHERDPSKPGYSAGGGAGIFWIRGARHVLVEDCYFQFFKNGMTWQEYDGFDIDHVTIRRTVVVDSWSDARPQGMYTDGVTNMLVEECVFDRNGWHPDVPEHGAPSIFDHNLYWQQGTDASSTLRNNIVMRGASHGIQMRSGGRAEGNLFVRNAISILIGGGTHPNPGGVDAWVIGNVILEGTDILPREGHAGSAPRGWAVDLDNIRSVEVRDNIAAHCIGNMCRSIQQHDGDFSNNIVWDWPAGGRIPEAEGPFVDPERSVASYNGSLGGEASFEAFAREVRRQSRTNWRPAYEAAAVNAYIREGFERL